MLVSLMDTKPIERQQTRCQSYFSVWHQGTTPRFLFFNIIIIFANLVFKTADIYCRTIICRILVQALEKVMATHSSILA